jgi:hypothetical protein
MTVQQQHAKLVLKLADLQTKGRLRHPYAVGGPRKTFCSDDCRKVAKLPYVHFTHSLDIHFSYI